MLTRAVVLAMIVIAVLGVAGASLADRDRTAWSPVVYPLQRLPLVFSHAKHLRAAPTARPATRRRPPRARRSTT